MNTKRSERGQSLVEFAISLVAILFLLAGAVEFGIAFFQFIQLRDAAQEGAVYGSICPKNAAKIESRVRNHSNSPVDLTNNVSSSPDYVEVVVKAKDGTTNTDKNLSVIKPGDGISVTVTYHHRIFMPFGNLFTGGNNTIRISATVTNTVLDDNMTKSACQ